MLKRHTLMGEDLLDNLVMEARDMVKNTIQGGASFGHQAVNMRMEVDAVAASLDHGHHSPHKLKKACYQALMRK